MNTDVHPIPIIPIEVLMSPPAEVPQRYRWDTVQLDEFGWFCHLTEDSNGPLYAVRDADGFLHVWLVNGDVLSA